MQTRTIDRVVDTPAPSPGFIGAGHTAVPVLDPDEFMRNDPFILLMDDRVDVAPGSPLGGAHPHAGFETVTFVVEGEVRDRVEGTLEEGDVLWMTAGSGVIHNEDVIQVSPFVRILQLWLTLPPDQRWVSPSFERIAKDRAPVRRERGAEVRVYSGRSGDVHSTTRNHVPVTLLDIRLEAGATIEQELPASYSGFFYVLDGALSDGVRAGQVAHFVVVGGADERSVLTITAGEQGARVVLYAGEPQNVPIVMHGPFVGGSRADLMKVSRDYMEGRFPRLSEIAGALSASA